MKKNGIGILRCIVCCIVVLTVISVITIFEFQNAERYNSVYVDGTEYKQSAAHLKNRDKNYTPGIEPGGIHIRQQFTPMYTGLDTIAIRIAFKKGAEMGQLTFVIYDDKGKSVWTQVIEPSEIVNWHYLYLQLEGTKLNKGRTYTIDAYMDENQNSGPCKLYLTGVDLQEHTQLFVDEEPMEGQLDAVYTYSNNQIKITSLVMKLIPEMIAVLSLVVLFVIDIFVRRNRKKK